MILDKKAFRVGIYNHIRKAMPNRIGQYYCYDCGADVKLGYIVTIITELHDDTKKRNYKG